MYALSATGMRSLRSADRVTWDADILGACAASPVQSDLSASERSCPGAEKKGRAVLARPPHPRRAAHSGPSPLYYTQSRETGGRLPVKPKLWGRQSRADLSRLPTTPVSARSGIVEATGNTSETRPKPGRRCQRGRIGQPGPFERSIVAPAGGDSRVQPQKRRSHDYSHVRPYPQPKDQDRTAEALPSVEAGRQTPYRTLQGIGVGRSRHAARTSDDRQISGELICLRPKPTRSGEACRSTPRRGKLRSISPEDQAQR